VADAHHFVRPGTDVHVLLSMLKVVLEEGLATVPSWADGVDRVAAAVAGHDPARAAARGGVPEEVIVELARELATPPRAVVHARMGVSTTEFGTVSQWAVQLLNLLTGHLDHEGGAMFTSP